ncbi:MAG TPA: hypothetical protein VKB88_45785 [Bryobacteraceae bacterium]|nr:hypothetical protein [Bryobacteraceae bacterium]
MRVPRLHHHEIAESDLPPIRIADDGDDEDEDEDQEEEEEERRHDEEEEEEEPIWTASPSAPEPAVWLTAFLSAGLPAGASSTSSLWRPS